MRIMVTRILEKQLSNSPKSLVLLGPRQVGKSTLAKALAPTLEINLADEETYVRHLKDPGLIKRMVRAVEKNGFIFIDEVQRLPAILNTVQMLIDEKKERRFLLTGSSARKLRRGQGNLLPGRLFWQHLSPLVWWEIKDRFDLTRALTLGTLPEVYLESYGEPLLKAYTASYIKEEIQAEALVRNVGQYSRVLEMAAELSGPYLNYSRIASESEISKSTIKNYFEILKDTLIIEQIGSYVAVEKRRKARQREKFIFFDLGVRNAVLGKAGAIFSREEMGRLFEQWLILQVIYLNRLMNGQWQIMSYSDDSGIEVDLIIKTANKLMAIEIKSAVRLQPKMTQSLEKFEKITQDAVEKYIVYQGEEKQRFDDGTLGLPYTEFLNLLYETT
jgi:predicted AAA+ superfamily ATPase